MSACTPKYKAIDPQYPERRAEQGRMRMPCAAFVLVRCRAAKALPKSASPQIQERSADLAQKFSENTLDATDRWAYYATAEEMQGIPDDVQQAAWTAAQAEGKDGYKLTLKSRATCPSCEFATHSSLRESSTAPDVTRASDQAEGDGQQYDNTRHHRRAPGPAPRRSAAAGLRRILAKSLVGAQDGQVAAKKVITFLRDLAQPARPYAEDVQDLRQFAREHLGPQPIPSPGTGRSSPKSQGSSATPSMSRKSRSISPPPRRWPGLFKDHRNLV